MERKSLAEWGFIVTLLLGGVFLAFSGIAAKTAGWLLILLAAGLTVWWWPDLRQLWSPKDAELRDLEISPRRHEEEGVGFMSAYGSTASLQIPSRTTLSGHLSEIEIINHSQTAPTEILGMRFCLFDPATGKEEQPIEILELELHPATRELRRIPPLDRRSFRLAYMATFKGYIDRENAHNHVFLMIKAIGSKRELKISLDKEFFF